MKPTRTTFIAELECTVCLEVPKIETRVFQCSNGHIFCQVCYIKLDLCPTCRKKLVCVSDIEKQHGPIRCLIAENFIRQFFNTQNGHQVVEESGRKTEIDFEEPKNSSNKELNGNKDIEPPTNKQINKIFSNNNRKDFGVYWGRRLPTML
jgi:hypothetical protein